VTPAQYRLSFTCGVETLFRTIHVADARAAVLSTLSSYSKAGFDGMTKAKAVARLAAALDSSALEAYASQLMQAFVTGSLSLRGTSCLHALCADSTLRALCFDYGLVLGLA
jgi:hypothetical protein